MTTPPTTFHIDQRQPEFPCWLYPEAWQYREGERLKWQFHPFDPRSGMTNVVLTASHWCRSDSEPTHNPRIEPQPDFAVDWKRIASELASAVLLSDAVLQTIQVHQGDMRDGIPGARKRNDAALAAFQSAQKESA